jgi:transposase
LGTVNKVSLREELDSLKEDFKQHKSNRKISPEAQALIEAILMLLEVVMAVFMEKVTKKNGKNSSIPSSQIGKDESSEDETGKTNKKRKENDSRAKNTRTVESTKLLKVTNCDSCGNNLSGVEPIKIERRTRIDIVFEKTVEHYDAEVKCCPGCKGTSKASFPKDLSGPLQYGHGIRAYVLNLLIAQMVSLNRIQKMVKTLIGMAISEATILKYMLHLNQALENWENQAIAELLKSKSLHVDETSMRVNKKNHWVHVCSSGNITLKMLHPKRGLEAIEAIGIIPKYTGTIIHDCWKSYFSYEGCGHGLCGAHLLRELTFIVDSNGYSWAKNIKSLLQETCKKVSKNDDKKLNDQDYKNLQKRYRNLLTRGAKELPPIPKRTNGKRGKVAKSDAHNLWERLQEYEKAVLLFARESHIAFTNNRAERDLRMGKVKQKVSGCFREERYAKAYCRISSYLQSMAYQGMNPHVAIQLALAGEFKTGG